MEAAKAAHPAAVILSPRGGSRPRARRRAGISPAPNSSSRAVTPGRRSKGTTRMTRSVWKGPFVDGYLLKKAEASRASGRHEMIRIWSRRSTILPQFVGLIFGVYNGQKHVPVSGNEAMVSHKFGEFSPTTTLHGHSGDKKAKKA